MCVREKRNHQTSGVLQQDGDWGRGREVRGEGIVLERSRVQTRKCFHAQVSHSKKAFV